MRADARYYMNMLNDILEWLDDEWVLITWHRESNMLKRMWLVGLRNCSNHAARSLYNDIARMEYHERWTIHVGGTVPHARWLSA